MFQALALYIYRLLKIKLVEGLAEGGLAEGGLAEGTQTTLLMDASPVFFACVNHLLFTYM